MKPLCPTHIPIPNRFGSLYCSNCGVWLDDGTAVAPTERAPDLKPYALPKPAPLRSDYENPITKGMPNLKQLADSMGQTIGSTMYGGHAALANVQTNWEKHCRRMLVSDSDAGRQSVYEIGLSGYTPPNDSFRDALHRAVAEVQRKVERIVTDNHLTEATYEITADENDTGKLNITVRGRRVL